MGQAGGVMKKIKWNRDKNGGCEFIMAGNTKYYIMDELLADGTISNYWHIEKREIINQCRKKYGTFKELLKDVFNEEAETETEAYWRIRSQTDYSNGSEELRTYTKNGRHFVVDIKVKEHWEYTKGEKISPDFRTVEELKKWADEFLNIEQSLF